jgi:biopolymer transport protein ExbD
LSESHDVKDTNVMGDINVTPLVDVMLVLLIIFMIITPALLAGFNAVMPEGEHMKARKDDPERTTLGIDLQGNYYLNKTRINNADAQSLLEAEFKKHPDDKVLFVKADSRLKYGELLKAFEMAKKCSEDIVEDKVTRSQLQ